MAKTKRPKTKQLPTRDQVATQDTWDLSTLYESDDDWEKGFEKFEKEVGKYANFKGKLGSDVKVLVACLKFDLKLDRQAERLGTYAFLRTSEDQVDGEAQRMMGRFQNLMTRTSEAASYMRPEIMAIPESRMKEWNASRSLAPYRLLIQRTRRYRKHTLGKKEEKILALQGEMATASSRIFRQLLDADLKFGTVKDESGQSIELTNATLGQLMISPKRAVRRRAFHQYYNQFKAHENTLTASLAGSVQKDAYYAKVRGYDSSLHAALYPDNVPESVYRNLIATVRSRLPVLHHYYDVRRRRMRLKDIHHYDTYVPILSEQRSRRSWDQAVKTIVQSLEPLGSEYCEVLQDGFGNVSLVRPISESW